MNRIFLVGAILIAATFLIANTPNTTMAYSCSISVGNSYSGTKNVLTIGLTGSSGSCASTSSSSTLGRGSTAGNVILNAHNSGPQVGTAQGFSSNPTSQSVGTFQSSTSGGAQSSCSSSSVSNTADAVISNSQSVSKSGTCP